MGILFHNFKNNHKVYSRIEGFQYGKSPLSEGSNNRDWDLVN